MSSELIINASLPETRIALMEDGEIQELLIERASGKGIVGNIYKGRVTRVLPGMQAAFVDIGLEKAAFLYVDDVYVHSEIWEEEEGDTLKINPLSEVPIEEKNIKQESDSDKTEEASRALQAVQTEGELKEDLKKMPPEVDEHLEENLSVGWADEESNHEGVEGPEGVEGNDESEDPVRMGPDPHEEDEDAETSEGGDSNSSSPVLPGTVAPSDSTSGEDLGEEGSAVEEGTSENLADVQGAGPQGRKRQRRGRRGGRFRRRGPNADAPSQEKVQEKYPENYHEQVADAGNTVSDRSALADEDEMPSEPHVEDPTDGGRPEEAIREVNSERPRITPVTDRSEFRAPRSRDRRIRAKVSSRSVKNQVNIQDLLKEGQEVLVQVAKDPIATKGARLTCHISLPGRHLVCMPTIDHVGVSRRIEREEERRRLREYVERNRPRNLGFIVRTASGRQQSEKRIKQDIDYLTRLWNEIREKAASTTAPALVYEDLNAVLRAVRDWVTEEIDKVIVDSRYHFSEILRFVSHFMPPLKQKVELYHGDIPIFDAYGISTELSRALERKVWLKSGGYIVVDQAEALVAIDVNTGRYVGKKNLEDTILKTNLEAVQEIAYQLRLRNCGGIIILDLIDMEKEENKQRVYRALEDALARDRARPTILKISELGLVEMTRKRTRDTIVRTLCESCTFCEGKGFIKSKQTVAYEVLREIEREGIERDIAKILVQAHPDIIDILAIDERETLDQLERRYRKQIYLQAVNDFHPEQFEVTADKREREKVDRGRDPHSSGEQGYERSQERNRNRLRTDASHSTTIVPVPIPVPLAIPLPLPVVHSETRSEPAAGNSSMEGVKINPHPRSVVLQVSHDPEGNIISPTSPTGDDGFYDEEDRLAFLRAQAAQDAALARLGSSPAPRVTPELNRGGSSPGGRRSGRVKRGGKFRGRNDQNRGRSLKPQGLVPNQKWNDSTKDAGNTFQSESDPSESEGPSGGGSGGGTGDHSNPPV